MLPNIAITSYHQQSERSERGIGKGAPAKADQIL